MKVITRTEHWPLKAPFVISRETIDHVPLLFLSIEDGGFVGCAEAVGVDYRGETPELLAAQVDTYFNGRTSLPDFDELAEQLPAGGARNAIDCALWDLAAKRAGQRVWELLGLDAPHALATVYTISLGSPEAMALATHAAPDGATLKLKLGGRDDADVERVRAARQAAPAAALLVDVNEGWSLDQLNAAAPALAALGVGLIEQPLPAGADGQLEHYHGTIPLCADESFDDLSSFNTLSSAYALINIKLDKCGGLTAGLACKAEAERRGLGVFVGSMLGTSLGSAPAFVLGQGAAFVDLDGPLLLANDRQPAMTYNQAVMAPFPSRLWG